MANPTSNSQLSEVVGEELPNHVPGMHEMLDYAAKAYPDNIAVVSMYQPEDLYAFAHPEPHSRTGASYLRWTQRMLHQSAHRLAASLQYHGVCRGTTISTVVPNGIEWILMVYASVMLGATLAPMSSRTLVNAAEAAHMLETAGSKVIVASDAQAASAIDRIDDAYTLNLHLKIQVDQHRRSSKWLPFSSLLEPKLLEENQFRYTPPKHDTSDLCIVAFTSGTTSLPKGCPLPNRAIETTIFGVKKRLRIDSTSVVCHTMPNNHLMAFFHLFSYPSVGGTVVFPSPAFDPGAVRTAFEEEKCTNFICVPTMLFALLDGRNDDNKKLKSLRQVDVAGAAVSPRHVHQCIYDLGAKLVGSSFGMTEGTPLRSIGVTNPDDLIKGNSVACGPPIPGARVRICEPGTQRIVPRGEYGELHQSGQQKIDHYLGLGRTDDFYTDGDGVEWFCSGDQAVMDDDGNICIVGRYKDMIIRGGENISPATIEKVLNTSKSIDVQVVGCKDDIAGETPVAVYQSRDPISVKSLQDLVLKHLGPIFVPSQFFSLRELGIDDFPKTVSGKIQKTKLAHLVNEHVQKIQAPTMVNGVHKTMKDQILRIWSSLLGIPPDMFDLNASVDDFADSITIMRFRDKLRKETGKNITLEEMIAHNSIGAQIHLLDNQPNGRKERRLVFAEARSGPPTETDIIHVSNGDISMTEIKALVEKAIGPHSFSWEEDVEDVIPAYDYINVQFIQQRAISHNRRHTIVTGSKDVNALKAALRASLSKHSNLRSFFIRHKTVQTIESASYITMRPNDRWFDQAIIEKGTIKSVAELKQYTSEDSILDHSFPGPLFRAHIFYVEETATFGFAYNANHVTFDAMAVRLFLEDLDKSLASPNVPLDQHIPFKFWADTYYSLRESMPARKAVKWHVQRLANLNAHRNALFPLQRAPRWFLGPSRGWRPTEEDSKKGYTNLNRESLSQPTSYESNGITLPVELRSIKKLRDAIPQMNGPAMAKAAMALMNVHFTQHTHALFTCIEAARSSLPFVPDHLAPHLDHINCADVSGPCFEFVVDLIEVRPEEPLSEFLSRLQAEQIELTRYAHGPVRSIVEALGTNSDGTGAGDMMLEVFRRQLFNWAPGAGNVGKNPYENIQQVLGNSQSDNGLVFMAGLGGHDGSTCTLNVRWDDANITREESENMIQTMAKILTWITEGGDWDRPVGKFVECL